MLPLSQLPSMSQALEWAKEDYQKAAQAGNIKGMLQAQRMMEKINRLGGRFGFNASPADLYRSVAALRNAAQQAAGRVNESGAFDPLTYGLQVLRSLPYPSGTKTTAERIVEQQTASDVVDTLARARQEAAKQAWEREKFYAPWTMGPKPSELLPYQYPTVGQQLQQTRWVTEWPYKRAQYEYNINKPYYKPDTGTGDEAIRKAYAGQFEQLGSQYYSPKDYLADLRRYAGYIIPLIGEKAYNDLVKRLQNEQKRREENYEEGEPWGGSFVPGSPSPLRTWLEEAGMFKTSTAR